jgi:prepilin-type N-terminal cleavage/methylation domain-containing protein
VKIFLKQPGFTLIEMALVIIVIGIIVSAVTSIVPEFIQSGKIKKAQAIVDKNIYAIEGYLAANGRCPCPDTDGDGLEDRNENSLTWGPLDDTCGAGGDIYEGGLPYRTIGLSSGKDSWGTALRYAVYDNCTRTITSELCNYFMDFVEGTYDGTLLRTNAGGVEPINYAYAVVSAGPNKDFDGKNSILDMEYELPDKMGDPDYDYDDILNVCSFVLLHGKHCSGYLLN